MLEGEVSLIGGDTCGIGTTTAMALALHSCEVTLNGRRANKHVAEVKSRIETIVWQCVFVAADVSQLEDVRRFVEEAARFVGGDILAIFAQLLKM